MSRYEVAREIENQCPRNQMRDVFFEEMELDDPVAYIRQTILGENVNITADRKENGDVTIFVESAGTTQKFLFTLL